MKNKLKELLFCSGADDCGITALDNNFAPAFGEGKYPFCEKIGAGIPLPEVKSAIVFVVSYNSKKTGNLSAYAFGRDYHKVLPEVAASAIELLRKNGYTAECYTDSGSLPERELAYRAGLGFIGKNHALIHPRLGSFIFIGYILTNCELEADSPLGLSCRACGKCLDACPSGALKSKDFYTCLSYITQKKGELSDSEAALIKACGTIWGCDICQRVCPHNADAPVATKAEFSQNLTLNLEIDEALSNAEFKKIYGEKAFSWRGKGVLLRNQKLLK